MKDLKNKQYWDRGAKMYDHIMKKDSWAYNEIYSLIKNHLNSDMNVLELATGTGLISLNIANYVKNIEAIDFSEKMIHVAKQKNNCNNVTFSVQDACNLKYADTKFDVVIISNSLHIMPNPQKALSEIHRVLKDDGILIAPNFTHKGMSFPKRVLAKLTTLTGFKVFYMWTPKEYMAFLFQNGFEVTFSKVLKASFPLTYVQGLKATR